MPCNSTKSVRTVSSVLRTPAASNLPGSLANHSPPQARLRNRNTATVSSKLCERMLAPITCHLNRTTVVSGRESAFQLCLPAAVRTCKQSMVHRQDPHWISGADSHSLIRSRRAHELCSQNFFTRTCTRVVLSERKLLRERYS